MNLQEFYGQVPRFLIQGLPLKPHTENTSKLSIESLVENNNNKKKRIKTKINLNSNNNSNQSKVKTENNGNVNLFRIDSSHFLKRN